ncbi:ATP-binding protein, partial [bacterium]
MIRRRAEAQIKDALEDTPAVLVHGPRQAGKSTLVREIGLPVVTLDDATPLDLARRRPEEFLHAYPAPIAIDEVQRAPELFRALKAAIDRDRKPGAYLLTGSANVLALPRLADSLAGRMEVVDLPPLSAAEIAESSANFVEALFHDDFRPSYTGDPATLPARLAAGGFPE